MAARHHPRLARRRPGDEALYPQEMRPGGPAPERQDAPDRDAHPHRHRPRRDDPLHRARLLDRHAALRQDEGLLRREGARPGGEVPGTQQDGQIRAQGHGQGGHLLLERRGDLFLHAHQVRQARIHRGRRHRRRGPGTQRLAPQSDAIDSLRRPEA
nr:MAG TPA: hypothetical protein [Caudoviricetes sp.]